jgi:hypothetical protein
MINQSWGEVKSNELVFPWFKFNINTTTEESHKCNSDFICCEYATKESINRIAYIKQNK